MSLSSISSFRTARSAFTAGFVAVSALLPFSAAAQQFQPAAFKTPVNCATIAESGKRAICETYQRIEANKQRGAAADKRGAEADRRGAAADARGAAADASGAASDKQNTITLALQACMDYIKKGTGIKFTEDEILAAANGKLNRENVCPVARKFGYEKSASLDPK